MNLNKADFSYAINYLCEQLANNVKRFATPASPSSKTYLNTETKIDICRIISKLNGFNSEHKKNLIDTMSPYKKENSNISPKK